jgi:hypothetical protein
MAVQGIQEFNRQMIEIIPAAILEATRQSIAESMAPVVNQMKGLAPYDTSTGEAKRRHAVHLRDTIRAEWSTAKNVERSALALRMLIIAGSAGTQVGARKVSMQKAAIIGKGGKQFQLARLIEFGTQEHKARPFFFPIWRAYRMRLRRSVSSRVNAVITQYSNTSSSGGSMAA